MQHMSLKKIEKMDLGCENTCDIDIFFDKKKIINLFKLNTEEALKYWSL